MSKCYSLLLLLVALSLGCTVDEPDKEQVGSNSVVNNTSANNSATGGNAGNGDANNIVEGSLRLMVSATQVEWGLFQSDVNTTASTLFDGVLAQDESAEVILPAGVLQLTFIIDGESFGIRTDRQVTAPAGQFDLGPAGEGVLVFNPGEATFNISYNGSGGVQLTRTSGIGTATALDARGHADSVGTAVDTFLRDYDPSSADRSPVFELLGQVYERGGGPIETDRGMLFLAPGVPGDSPELVGSFNDWQQTPGWELRQLVPGVFARFVELPDGQHSYKIAYGDSWTKDQANRHIEWDGIDTQSVGFFNSVVRPDSPGGRLVLLPDVESDQLGNVREVYVYLPPAYDEGSDHPLLIVHDGNESIVRARFHHVLDTWSQGQPAAAQPVVAFVALPTQNVRMAEYTFATEGSRGNDYADFLGNTLHPYLTETFRVSEERHKSGLLGASLGGLISYYVLSRHSDAFGYAAGMSSTFFWGDNAMLDIIAQEGCFDADFYLDSGSPNDNFVVTQQMRDLLNSQGCRYRYVLDEGGTHEWWKWEERLPGVLDHFAEVTQR